MTWRKLLLLAVSLIAGLRPSPAAVAADLKQATVLDYETLEFKILSGDGRQAIGKSHFTVLPDKSGETIRGASVYFDGERDNEEERMGLVNGALRLETYEHSFFSADGAAIMIDTVDTVVHLATCARRENGVMSVTSSRREFPADTFAGGSQLLMLMAALRGGRRKIDYHAFACVSGPRVFPVAASVPERTERWSLYPGDLMRLDLRPDLGYGLDMVVGPFLPKTQAWFDPRDNWQYVGGEFNRYFRGPHVFQVIVSPSK
jgi:hypothetical protein